MMDFRGAEIVQDKVPTETVKIILENIDEIQRETMKELRMIADAVYRGNCNNGGEVVQDEQPRCEPIVIILGRQRQTAIKIRDEVIQIREALW